VALGIGTGIVVHVNTPQTKGGRISKLNRRGSKSRTGELSALD